MADRLAPPMPPQFQFPTVDPSTAPSDEEAAFARFLQEAPLILARERGLNARSLALLDAHGRRMGLSAEDTAAAVRLLRPDSTGTPPPPPTSGGGTVAAPAGSPTARVGKPGSVPTPPPPPPEQPAEERAFEAWLVCNAKRIPDGVFRPYLERRARSIAVERFGVEPTRLDDVLDRTLAAVGMKRFTADEARRNFRAYLAQRLSQGDRIGRSDLEEFYRHGESWGYSSSETDDELFSVRRSLAHADERDRSMGARYAALAIGAVIMTGGFLAALFLFPEFLYFGPRAVVEDPSTTTAGGETVGGGETAPVVPPVDSLPEWWNSEAALAHSQLARERSGAPWVADARSADATHRSRAYGAMASELAAGATSPVVRQALERLWQELILIEPDAKASEALREETFELIAPKSDAPGGPQEYTISFATLQALGRALSRFDAPPERVEDWKRALAAKLKLAPGSLADVDWLSSCFAAVGSLWLERLAESDLSLADVTERRNVLQRMLERFVASRKETDRVEAQFVRDYLLRHGGDWETFQASLSLLSMSTSTQAVAALIDLMEGTSDAELKEALASSLRRRYDRPSGEAPDELAANLRGALGIAMDSDFERRRRLNAFRIKAEPWVVQDRFVFSTPKNALVDLQQLARLTTQAWALESELRHPIFDELAKEPETEGEVEEVDAPAFAGGSSFVQISPEKLTQLEEYAAALEKARELAPAARLDLLRRITRFAGDGSDVPSPVADGILDYAAGDFVTSQEARIVATEMAKISEWPTVTLALVDAIGVWPEATPSEQRQQLLRAFLPAWAPAEKDWKSPAAAALLEKASRRLDEIAGGSGGASPEHQELAGQIAELIDLRREMLAPGKASPSESIGAAYRALAQAAMNSVEAAASDSKALAEARPLFQAVERLASGDLQRAALYQRLVVRLEAERAARETPAFADRARQLVETLALADAESTDVMQQLLFGERTLFLLAMRGEEAKK